MGMTLQQARQGELHMTSSQSENMKRIAKNTLALYVRMLLSMLVSLYTSRVVLNTLGVEDYGIYNVVGGLVAMFSLVSSSLSSAVGRFLTFELGRGDTDRLKRVFSTSLSIHITLMAVIFLLMETAGVWFLNTRMTIPAERFHAANWVFQASILSFLFGLFSVPYNASIVAHERMKAFAYIGILDVTLRLLIVLFIAHAPWLADRLIAYALLLVTVSISLQIVYLRYCRKHFEECQLRLCFDKACWKEMSSFAGWNFIGCTALLLKDQGVNILLNLFLGPIINAARGIAMSVNTAVSGFAGNFMAALTPQITKSYAAGQRDYMMTLVERGSRFSFYILLLPALPILMETDFVLTLWLKQYPAHTVNFVRLVLLLSMLDILSNTLVNLQTATGKIRNYQLAVGGMLMMNFPLSYICLWRGMPPESVLLVALFVSACCLLLRLLFLRHMVSLSIRRYLHKVCLNVFLVFVASSAIPLAIWARMEDGWGRFVSITALCMACTLCTTYWIGCSTTEQQFVRTRVRAMKERLTR